MAQIAMEAASSGLSAKARSKLRLSDYLLSFAPPEKEKPVKPKEKVQRSKSAWLAWAFGLETKK